MKPKSLKETPFPRFRTKMVKKLRLVSLITLFQQSPLNELNKYGPCAVRTSAIHVRTWDFYKMISPDFVREKSTFFHGGVFIFFPTRWPSVVFCDFETHINIKKFQNIAKNFYTVFLYLRSSTTG